MVTFTITWHYPPILLACVSAWDAARNHYGPAAFDALNRDAQINAVRASLMQLQAELFLA